MPGALRDARLQLHWAAQIPGAFGAAYAQRVRGVRPTALRWHARHQALASSVAEGTTLRCAIHPASLAILIMEDEVVVKTRSLRGATLADSMAWVEAEMQARGHRVGLASTDAASLPPHAVAHGGRFDAAPDALRRLALLFGDAAGILEKWRMRFMNQAGPVLLWPHHFDIASLRTVVPESRPGLKDARTIGFGMTPGDASYAAPYWYVTPWPYPTRPELPALAEGAWHTEGWLGAVLPAIGAEAGRIRRFLESASGACEHLIDCPMRPDCPHYEVVA